MCIRDRYFVEISVTFSSATETPPCWIFLRPSPLCLLYTSLVAGGVANDKVFNTVELFFDGLIDKTEAINRLRYEKPNLQICFRTEKALSLLHFEGSEIL